MKKLFLLISLLAIFAGSGFAQNSLTWEQDGKRCTINLFTGDFSITCFDNAGNSYTIYGPEYDFDVNAVHGSISYLNGRVSYVGSTSISYLNGKVSYIGPTSISYLNGRVSYVGSTSISYLNGKVSYIGSTSISYLNGRVSYVGSASISYLNGKVSSINGKVR